MPWQAYVADVALEIDPDTGQLAYDEVGLTVPRQSGKTSLVLAKAVHRCTATSFFGPRQQLVYTAQTRQKARQKWREDFVLDLEQSSTFAPRVSTYLGGGDEHIRFKNRSRFGIESNTEKAGHGGTIDEAYIDEAFAQIDGRLEQAFSPAMITRSNTQLWWLSTAGWEGESLFLQPKVERGRAQTEMRIRSGLCYFEWSAPDDAEPDDRDAWWACMPALGHTITEAKIAAELRKMADNLADFRRAYLNQWVPKGGDRSETVVDMERWAGLADLGTSRPAPVAFAVAASPDRRWSTIAVAGFRADDHRQVQVVQSGRGTDWVVARVAELAAEWSPLAVAVSPDDPIASLIPDLIRAKVKLVSVSTRETAQGCGLFVDGIADGTIHHANQPVLNIALGAARKRRAGESWVWTAPPGGKTDISPLKAVTLALYALTSKKKPARSSTPRRAVIL
jgi:hypothetical protein